MRTEMKAGIDFIRQNAMDRVNGGMSTVQKSFKGHLGTCVGALELRTPQQLAYGLLGTSFYYYLTGDPDVLKDVLAVKNYIFETRMKKSAQREIDEFQTQF